MPEPTIFDDVLRTNDRPSRHSESRSGFLNRAAGPVFDRIRALVEEWYEHYPSAGRADLRARLRSNSSDAFGGAFWELYQHETLTRMGFDLTLHPVMLGTTKRPDFLARRQGETGFYLEATLASPSREERAAKRRLGAVLDLLNDLSTPSFFLGVEIEKQGPVAPATGRLRKDLVKWLNGLDADALIAESHRNASRHAHEHVWEEAGWRIEFTPIPKSREHRGQPGRAIGMSSEGARFVDTKSGLRRAIREKAGHYGRPDRPYVLAVLIEDEYTDQEDVFDALFGTVSYRLSMKADGELGSIDPVRQRDGPWFAHAGPSNTRVSAVMTAIDLQPSFVARGAPRLWHNPWAGRPLTESLVWRTTRVDVVAGSIDDHSAAMPPGNLLCLPAEWPGPEDPFPRD
jgi:hypothetical protein